jgi:hypothetical protein
MNRASLVLAWVFVGVGAASLVRVGLRPRDPHAAWAVASAAVAIAGGAAALRGARWARWVLAAWLAAHVAISARHDRATLLAHAAILVAGAWILFRRPRAVQ